MRASSLALRRFNSKLVRLKASGQGDKSKTELRFNSKLVRLKDKTGDIYMVQELRFNSKLVRLKVAKVD